MTQLRRFVMSGQWNLPLKECDRVCFQTTVISWMDGVH